MEKRFSHLINKAIWICTSTSAAFLAYYWIALRPLPFDSDEWNRAKADRRYNICYRMSASLVQKLSSEMISANQMIALLGKPDLQSPVEWRYKLKAQRYAIFPDDYWLSVFISVEDQMVIGAVTHPG